LSGVEYFDSFYPLPSVPSYVSNPPGAPWPSPPCPSLRSMFRQRPPLFSTFSSPPPLDLLLFFPTILESHGFLISHSVPGYLSVSPPPPPILPLSITRHSLFPPPFFSTTCKTAKGRGAEKNFNLPQPQTKKRRSPGTSRRSSFAQPAWGVRIDRPFCPLCPTPPTTLPLQFPCQNVLPTTLGLRRRTLSTLHFLASPFLTSPRPPQWPRRLPLSKI